METELPNIKLDRNEFAAAIQKGLGRAMLHMIQHGLDGVHDLVLDACLHNYVYDTQIDSSRAPWLFQMFGNSVHYPKFSETILGALKTEADERDLRQLYRLAKEMAAHGDKIAWQILRECVLKEANTPSDDWMCADLWIVLEGVNGFLELARIYGNRLLADPNDWVPDDIVYFETHQEFKDALFQSAEKDLSIRAYRDYLAEKGVLDLRSNPIEGDTTKQQNRERIRKTYSLDSILNDAQNGVGEFPGRYSTFGHHATTDELEKVYNQLCLATDSATQLRLLWVFRRAQLPQLDEMLFNWAEGTDDNLRSASISALAQVSHERVHALARSKVKTGQLLGADNDVLDLFIRNFGEDDIQLITQALVSLEPNRDDAHSLGFSLLDLSENQSNPNLVNALKWVYENTPCANCRYRAIKQLSAWQRLDNEILYECQFDADEDIRNFKLENLKNYNK